MALNRAQVTNDISIEATSGNGFNYVVQVSFFDSAAPTTILWTETFHLPIGSTTAQLQAAVVAKGNEVRTVLAQQAAARVAVPVNTTITVP